MKKKVLSLALALALCLGLTIPAFAAEPKVGDTSITDSNGVTYQFTKPIAAIETNKTVTYTGFEGEKESTVLEKAYALPKGTIITIITPKGYRQSEFLLDGVMFENVNDPSDTINMISGTWAGMGGVPKEGLELYRPYVTVASMHGSQHSGAYYFVEADAETPTDPEPTTPAKSETATPTNDKLTVNGEVQNPTVYKIDGNNYFKIRDLAAVLNGTEKQIDVGYDGKLNSVTVTTGKSYAKLDTDLAGAATGGNQTADPSNDTIYIDGQKVDAVVYKINGNNYFKLRDLGKALNFSVDWSREAGMMIDTSKPYTE